MSRQPTRPCEHVTCRRKVRRKAKTGPWPRWCAEHKKAHEKAKQREYRPLKYVEPVACLDCPALVELPAFGKRPKRCPECAEERRRQQSAVRQQRFRDRHGT